jgi:type VI protein secretion system component Hcp
MRKITHLLFAVAFMFTCSYASAQTTTVMKALDGTTQLNGGSTVAKHLNEIDLYSYSQGESNCVTCHASLSSFNAMIKLTPATVSLKKLLLNGTKLTSVDVVYIKPGITPFVYYKIRMENVTVESVQESGSSEEPIFSVSLVPERMAWQHIAQKANGAIGVKTSYGWDITTNTEWVYGF